MSEGSKSRLPFFPFPSTSWVQGRIEWEDFLDVCLSLESTLDRRKTVYCHYTTIPGGWIHSSSSSPSGNLSMVVVPALSGYFCSLLECSKDRLKMTSLLDPTGGKGCYVMKHWFRKKKNYWKMMLQHELDWCEWSTWFLSAKKGLLQICTSHIYWIGQDVIKKTKE